MGVGRQERERAGALARVSLAGVLIVLLPLGAAAKLCGDSVNGADVPCECGDTVASDVVLGDDPVTSQVCEKDGLVVRRPDPDVGVTIDLNGKTLRGDGRGTGLWIVNGGGRGARVISSGSPATIDGFGDGIVGRGPSTVVSIERVIVRSSHRDGVKVADNAYTIRDVEVLDSGRDGFSLGGGRFLIEDTHAVRSGRFGYFVMGREGRLGTAGHGTSADGSGNAGFTIQGSTHLVTDCVANGNRKEGVKLRGTSHRVTGCVATSNGKGGIVAMGTGVRVATNEARSNGGDGLFVRGTACVDGGGNRGSENGGAGIESRKVQCEVCGSACR